MKDLIIEARELCEKAYEWDRDFLYGRYATDAICKIPELCDALEKAEAEIERLRAAQRWRELEKEPCGDIGQKALLYGIGGVNVGEYLGEGDWNVEYKVMPGETFTQWMPLPAPPKEG